MLSSQELITTIYRALWLVEFELISFVVDTNRDKFEIHKFTRGKLLHGTSSWKTNLWGNI